MRNGLKRHRIQIQQRPILPDANGVVSTAWTDVATVWAEKKPMRGKEIQQGGKDTTDIRTVYVTDYLDLPAVQEHNQASISERMRLVDGTETYQIISVQNRAGRNRQMEIVAQKAY